MIEPDRAAVLAEILAVFFLVVVVDLTVSPAVRHSSRAESVLVRLTLIAAFLWMGTVEMALVLAVIYDFALADAWASWIGGAIFLALFCIVAPRVLEAWRAGRDHSSP